MDRGNGWLTTLTDLSIILFMVTAADLANTEPADGPAAPDTQVVTADQPVAIFRPQPDGASLSEWLAAQQQDARLRLTIMVRYGAGERQAALETGLSLVRQAELAGRSARLIVEEGPQSEVLAVQAYDNDRRTMARNLLGNNHDAIQEDET